MLHICNITLHYITLHYIIYFRIKHTRMYSLCSLHNTSMHTAYLSLPHFVEYKSTLCVDEGEKRIQWGRMGVHAPHYGHKYWYYLTDPNY